MARSPAPAPASTAPAWPRVLLVAVVVLAVAAAGVLVFLPRIRFQMRIGQLHAQDAETRRAAVQALVESEDPATNDRLQGVLLDPGQAFTLRLQVGEILIRRNRDRLVIDALGSPDLDVRTSALAVLHGQARYNGEEWFQRTFVDDPRYQVRETLTEWLARDGDLTRATALTIAQDLEGDAFVPLVRGLLTPPREGPLSKGEQGVLVAALHAVVEAGDCAAVNTVQGLTTSTTDDVVRLRAVQALHQLVTAPRASCPDAMSTEAVKDSLFQALADGGSVTRHGVLLILSHQPEWTAEVLDRVYAILDGTTGDTEFVRRQALTALAALGGEAFAARLPRYFHADEQYIRSQATSASVGLTDAGEVAVRFESCWIGVLEREVENATSYQLAVQALRDQAGEWVGLPEGLPFAGEARREAVKRFRADILERGESGGVSRADWAEAWFRWWAERLDVEGDALEDALRVRGEFWTAAAADDVEKARAVLEAHEIPHPDLFRYEEGWLEARSAS